ncbi:MAG: serine/threonine protein kinase [Akkermansiaceae bacterium]
MNDRYEILQLLVKDEVGGVYLAEDSMLGRKVAFRNFERSSDEEILTELNEEFSEFSGKLTALQHPNLITIYDIAFDDGEAYMVTQYVEDESLSDRLETGPLPQDRVYKMATDVLEALHAAHESGIYHGALNTQSIRRIPRASGGHRYMVVDMGLNHLAGIIRGVAGEIVDPILIAPELHDGKDLNARADLFMLAQLCYTALAGGHPFAEKTKEECAELYLSNSLPPIEEYVSGVQEDFMQWVRHLAKGDPNERPADTQEAMRLLNQINLPDPEPPVPVAQLASPPVAVPVAAPAAPATAAMATQPMTTAAGTQPIGEAVPPNAELPEAKLGKKPLIIILALIAVIGSLVGYLIFKKDGGSEVVKANSSGLPAAPDGVLVHMHSADALESEPVDLEAGETLDWSVTTGVPISSSRKRRENGKYITNVLQTGKFKELVGKAGVIKYKAGDEDLVSKGVSNTKNKVAAGKGWEVYIRIPNAHKGPLLVNCYVIHKGCGLDIIANAAKAKEPIKFSVEKNEIGKSNILLEIPDPVPSGFYTVKILAAEVEKGKPIVIGLGAIRVSEK